MARILATSSEVTVTDFGTSITKPEDYLNHLNSFAIFSNKNGKLETPLGMLEEEKIKKRSYEI